MKQQDYVEGGSQELTRNSPQNALVQLQNSIGAIGEVADQTMNIVSSVSSTITDVTNAIGNMNLEMKRVDAQLSAFLAHTDANLQRFKAAAPMIEKQLDKASERLDKITDKLLDLTVEAETETDLKKQSLLLDALSNANEQFNGMIAKLMSI